MTRKRSAAPTLRDVCRVAGVSVGTASRVLNPVATRDNTSPQTRDRVRSAAEKLGYRVNAAARGMRGGRQGAILWLQHVGSRPRGRWEALERCALQITGAGQHLIFCPLPQGDLDPEQLPKAFSQHLADAAVLCLGRNMATDVVERMRGMRSPWILANGRINGPCIPAGDEDAGAALTTRLIALGHRRIAYVDPGYDGTAPLRRHISRDERLAGYRRAMGAAGLEPWVRLDADKVWGDASEVALLRSLLSDPQRPTAVVVQSAPCQLPEVAVAMGLQVPRDLSIASPGLDHTDSDGLISGLAVDWAGIGAAAAGMLARMLAGGPVQPVVVPHLDHPGRTIAPPAARTA
jgi:LacI family transcriptional regulator